MKIKITCNRIQYIPDLYFSENHLCQDKQDAFDNKELTVKISDQISKMSKYKWKTESYKNIINR